MFLYGLIDYAFLRNAIALLLLLAEVVFRRPFSIQGILPSDEKFCQGYYWKLLDESPPRHVYEEPKNMTVYFGRNFILKELKLVISLKHKEEFGKKT